MKQFHLLYAHRVSELINHKPNKDFWVSLWCHHMKLSISEGK
jgi:hypothetical protein